MIQTTVEECTSLIRSTITNVANVDDRTKWIELAPAANDVTKGYISAVPENKSLACSRALLSASDEALERGGLYPFSIGLQQTNSLLFAIQWVCNLHAAKAFCQNKCTAKQALAFAHEHSRTWNALSIAQSMQEWTGPQPTSFDLAVKAAAHARFLEDSSLISAFDRLALLSFILKCPQLPGPPTKTMEDDVWRAATTEDTYTPELKDLVKLAVDAIVSKAHRSFPTLDSNAMMSNQLNALCIFFHVPPSLLFDV